LISEVGAMTGKERIAKAMRHEKADRVPVFCQLSIGHYMLRSGKVPYKIWFSPDEFTDALVELARRYRFDGVLVNLPGRPRDWENMISSTERRPGETRISWRGGSVTVCPDADNAHYFSTVRRPSIDEIDPASLYYIEPHCITEVTYPFSFDFAEPGAAHGSAFFPEYYLDTLRHAVKKCGEELHVSSEVFSPFTQLMELLGYAEALMALLDDPGKCESCLASLAEGCAELAVLQARAGADAVLVSSAFAGAGFISLEQYRRFVLPYEKHVVERIHRETSVPIYVHTCGSIADRIGAMTEAGYDGIDTMDPPPLGNSDIGRIKKEFGDKIFLKGNLDPVNILLNGSEEAVSARADELIRMAGAGGSYILSTACSVPPGTDPEKIALLAEASARSPY
jgi:uroporphyrinogen-III decarboxylase